MNHISRLIIGKIFILLILLVTSSTIVYNYFLPKIKVKTINIGNIKVKKIGNIIESISTSDFSIKLRENKLEINNITLEDENKDGFIDIIDSKLFMVKNENIEVKSNKDSLIIKYKNKTIYAQSKKEKIKVLDLNLDGKPDYAVIKPNNSKQEVALKEEKNKKEITFINKKTYKPFASISKNYSKKEEIYEVTIDLDENGVNEAKFIFKDNSLYKYSINYVETAKVLGKDLVPLVLKFLKTKNFSILDDIGIIIKKKFPDKYGLFLELKNNPSLILKYLVDYNLTKILERINSELREKEEVTNLNKDIFEVENQTYKNFGEEFKKCEETIKEYYLRIKLEKNVSDLFSDFVDKDSLEKIHNSLYESFDFIKINISNIYCYKYSNDFIVCDYTLFVKFKDKNNNILERKTLYSTILDSNCLIVQTLEK